MEQTRPKRPRRQKKGRKPRIDKETWEKIANIAKTRPMSIEEARKKAEMLTGKKISYDTAWWWLRKKLKTPYRKPYPKNKKTPPNAKEILKERLVEGIKKAVEKAKRKNHNKILLAFADETAIQDKPNIRRVLWGNIDPMPLTGRRKFYALGAYVVNGESVAIISNKCKTGDFVELLRLLRKSNPKAVIVLVVDNAKIHWARDTRRIADELGIVLVYLPPYSPHLNPIEFVWRDCKRDLSVYVFEERLSLFLRFFKEKVSGGGYIGFVEVYVSMVEAFSGALPPAEYSNNEYISFMQSDFVQHNKY